MLAALTALMLTATPALAAHPSLPSRPTTYPVDTNVSEGPVEGFREVYADPYTLKDKLTPVRKFKPVWVPVKPQVVITKEKVVVNDQIYFALDKAEIDPRSHELLDALAEALNVNADIVLLHIEGHTDTQGADDYNLDLSQRRAQAVVDYLVAKGITQERLAAVGKGETEVMVAEDTEAAHALNRRVAFMIEQWDTKTQKLLDKGERALPDADQLTQEFRTARQKVLDAAQVKSGSLPVINLTSGWAKVSVGDLEVGMIGPYTNALIKDVPAGYYEVTFFNSVGYTWTDEMATIQWEGPIIPGGRPAQVSVEKDVVPSWYDDPAKGYVSGEAKAAEGVKSKP